VGEEVEIEIEIKIDVEIQVVQGVPDIAVDDVGCAL
jgi:hypothetical protein